MNNSEINNISNLATDSNAGDGVDSEMKLIRDAYIQKELKQNVSKNKRKLHIDILDLEELKYFQNLKRREFEEYLKRNRLDGPQWIRYADYEVEQRDIQRARSIFERALRVNNANIPLWIHYIDVELKNKSINHARNLLDRATTLLPQVSKLWYKYVYVEEALGQIELAREVFRKWMEVTSNETDWDSYVEFEIRHQNYDNVRKLFSNHYLKKHSNAESWLKCVNFEQNYSSVSNVRNVYSLAVDTLANNGNQINALAKVVSHFANWECEQGEMERASKLYEICLKQWPNNALLKNFYAIFAKQFGDKEFILDKRAAQYREQLLNNPTLYTVWWIYFDLLENTSTNTDNLKEAFELFEGISSTPNSLEKTDEWKQYIWIWIRILTTSELKYGVRHTTSKYEYLVNQVLKKIQKFTFGKIWVMYAKYLIRNLGDVKKARKTLGYALGRYPKKSIFHKYIKLECDLKEFDRARKLYEKLIEFEPLNLQSWLDYVKLEDTLGDIERCHGIFNAGLKVFISTDEEKKRDEKLLPKWYNEYIKFETEQSEYTEARKLWNDFCNKVGDTETQIWVNWAYWECSAPTDSQLEVLDKYSDENEDSESEDMINFDITQENIENGRKVLEKALVNFRGDPIKRLAILKKYVIFEKTYGTNEHLKHIQSRLPIIKHVLLKKNGIEKDSIQYQFPDDANLSNGKKDEENQESEENLASSNPMLKLLTKAKEWKEQQYQG
ncbi:related to Pre-mRNA-splicing factor CLF1 [Saccharomycodes ludwigii]|uniref:Pre-mRNA-splicing factor CLF1 n=1 Tax=Saccharomycodes ludwigii TaxID=36035 RepID=A0A376BBL8_9ASCO|nr:hypothetical protein SCDLUD_001745 [Saccharomycodes ludwigii]KAH3901959.1 hypothetical protein SCDLUD_001745 [Saccharomycodes ludwigii]SSD61979.1 related to Pre-mRNA-splicing factor CLF1 [Saccharomycodes ludwigii]